MRRNPNFNKLGMNMNLIGDVVSIAYVQFLLHYLFVFFNPMLELNCLELIMQCMDFLVTKSVW
jgi:hypothetical protein